jgi:plasmid replication initiation protein
MEPIKNQQISFKRSAIYKIIVQGKVNKSILNRHKGMQLTVDKEKEGKTISSIIGVISDQTALSSLLNNLYEKHFTVISVNMLSEI